MPLIVADTSGGTSDTVRAGAAAKCCNATRPGDPTDPSAANARAAATDAAMLGGGFGDHRGGRIRGPDEKGGEQR